MDSGTGGEEKSLGLTLRLVLRPHMLPFRFATFLPDGKTLATTEPGSIKFWDCLTGLVITELRAKPMDPDTEQMRVPSGSARLKPVIVAELPPNIDYVAGSPDGGMLVYASATTGGVWDISRERLRRTLDFGTTMLVKRIAWSGDGRYLAWPFDGYTIRLWDQGTGRTTQLSGGLPEAVHSLSWCPTGKTLAVLSDNPVFWLWDLESDVLRSTLQGHSEPISDISWSPDGTLIASGSIDKTVRIWDGNSGQQKRILEGHTSPVRRVTFLLDGQFLVSEAIDGKIILWQCDTWESAAIFEKPGRDNGSSSKPNRKSPIIFTFGKDDSSINICELDRKLILGASWHRGSIHYSNAKVVLVGDTGVGKSGLAFVLTKQPYRPTDSTHGRHVWMFDSSYHQISANISESRETILWDLAGQPGYRLTHQLHLNEVAVALVVFDARSETDPFGGVRHWNRAILQAQHIKGKTVQPIKKFLVAARVDRGNISVSRDRIEAFLKDYQFDGYFETSAKQGWQIQELSAAVAEGIDWGSLPRVSSNRLFQDIKSFLVKEKGKGRLLSTSDDLYSSFSDLYRLNQTRDLRAQFETCIGLVESRDLIRRLNFGNFILLQPEVLDSYASAIVNSAKTEPDGLGSIAEDDVHAGKFSLPQTERIADKEEERILIIATIEDMLRHEIAMREQADEGVYLVFPSQLTRANPDLPDPEGKAVVFTFEGPVVNVYATLVVRLSHSGFFEKKELWQNAATFTAKVGGTCGVFIREKEEGRAELALFFDSNASKETRIQFEDYILAHLKRRALSDSIRKEYVYICENCATPVTSLQVDRRRERGYSWLLCSVCGQRIAFRDREDRFVVVRPSIVSEMDRSADEKRERSAAALVLQGKIAKGEFDVFLCHNSEDKAQVAKIGNELKLRGILPWLDEWELRPGLPWQRLLEKQIDTIRSAAVFVGENGMGPWQQMELEAFLREFAGRNCPVIPVLLPTASKKPSVPLFLKAMTWVDFTKKDPDPMERLIWGITGKRSSASQAAAIVQ